ncbi:MAG: hypothetical protein AAFO29_06535 [Actinomycetota bacterium]
MRRRFRRSTTEESPVDRSESSDAVTAAADHGDPASGADPADTPSFDALLARELANGPDPAAAAVDAAAAADAEGDGPDTDGPIETNDPTATDRADEEPEVEPALDPIGHTTDDPPAPGPDRDVAPFDEPPVGAAGSGPLPGDFWDRYDQAKAEAELSVVPPAAVVAVVGPLDAAIPVIDRCRDRHWMGRCDVFVLTQLPSIPDHPDWTPLQRPSDLVAVLDEGGSDFPLLVLDVPCDLPAFVRPLVGTLRERGVGLIHYVLDDQPVDEDLATWHGELGQPSVLDLTGAVPADRVLELVDRGEPVVSVAGNDLSTELLLALRIERAATERQPDTAELVQR